MNIRIICIGKLKEKYWQDASNEYIKRLKPFCNIEIVELKEYKITKNPSPKDEEIVKIKEGEAILSKIKDGDYVISLEILGKQISSEMMAEKLIGITNQGYSDFDFVIGGNLGLSDEVSKRANFKLSFSLMTFPHQMMRIILLEQIYRSFMINKGTSYHK
ncbi:23S rRNA (pseudouridine(1915)-N(3))-methyltransferase RlmH [Alterileibacterium massiliense]|uniref:23S rRNA (pseudouridine(1915)-N(3))-methyltransferase RlmH n=1 Tax=Alterileibacterium massiliense TaxID=1870997 RepID=UPI0008D9DD6B|nr:23S rRNA (pseudouridine(1915)-N(3))-methyltransferase RlmH [Alterileibacterium massiliense]